MLTDTTNITKIQKNNILFLLTNRLTYLSNSVFPTVFGYTLSDHLLLRQEF